MLKLSQHLDFNQRFCIRCYACLRFYEYVVEITIFMMKQNIAKPWNTFQDAALDLFITCTNVSEQNFRWSMGFCGQNLLQ